MDQLFQNNYICTVFSMLQNVRKKLANWKRNLGCHGNDPQRNTIYFHKILKPSIFLNLVTTSRIDERRTVIKNYRRTAQNAIEKSRHSWSAHTFEIVLKSRNFNFKSPLRKVKKKIVLFSFHFQILCTKLWF